MATQRYPSLASPWVKTYYYSESPADGSSTGCLIHHCYAKHLKCHILKGTFSLYYDHHIALWLYILQPSDAGRDWGQEEKGMTEDEMAGWHHWLDGRESQWTPRIGDGQGGLACCDSWGCKESTQLSDWSDLILLLLQEIWIHLKLVSYHCSLILFSFL